MKEMRDSPSGSEKMLVDTPSSIAISKLHDVEAALGQAIRGKPEAMRLSLV